MCQVSGDRGEAPPPPPRHEQQSFNSTHVTGCVMESSIVLCYNINKLTYLLTYYGHTGKDVRNMSQCSAFYGG